ncbi:MAG: alpha/beta hydrolase [Bacteroidetes bacterium]|nr:alpha/beta hydrolase [Bacteroidota bacterium]
MAYQILIAATYFALAIRIQISTRIRRAIAVVLALGVGVPLLLYVSLDGEKAVVSDEIRATTDESDVTLSDEVTEYQLSDADSAQTVIMISGASVPYYIFDVTYDSLVDAGFRVLRYNYYGRGFSDQPIVRYDRALYERRISELVDRLGLRKPYDSMGLSLGGLVTVSHASANPGDVRRIAFDVPAYRQCPPPGLPEWLSEIRFALS